MKPSNTPMQIYGQVIADRDGGWFCFYCQAPLRRTFNQNDPSQATLDHVKPLSIGGETKPDNLVLCCRACNATKGGIHPRDWKYYLARVKLVEIVTGEYRLLKDNEPMDVDEAIQLIYKLQSHYDKQRASKQRGTLQKDQRDNSNNE